MKKYSRITLVMAGCLAGFIGQLTAFGANTNSVWDLNAINILKVGKLVASATNEATAVFLDDGTCSLVVGADEFDGTYAIKGNSVTVTFDADNLTALETNAVDFLETLVPPGSATAEVKSLKITKIKLKDGIPVKAGDTAKVLVTAVATGKHKNIKLVTLWTDWVLTSGTIF